MDIRQNSPSIDDAIRLHQSGDLEKSLRICQQILLTDSQNPPAVHMLGLNQCRQGAIEEGLANLRRSISLFPNSHKFHSNIASVLGRLQQFEESLSHLREAVRLQPDYVLGHLNLGVTLEHLEDYCAAEVVYRRVLELSPNNTMGRYRLGAVLYRLGQFEESDKLQLGVFELNPPPQVPPEAFPALTAPRVVVVVTCKGRLAHLKQTLPQMLDFDFPPSLPDYRVVVVDYLDPDNSFDWCQSLRHPRLMPIRVVDNAELFQKSRAFNCGASALPSDLLAVVDADSIFHRSFLRQTTEIVSRAGVVLTRREPSTDVMDTIGACVMRTAAYHMTRGYDEEIHGHGPEDIDMFARLGQLGTVIKFPGTLYPRAIHHPHSLRTQFHTIKDPAENAAITVRRLFDPLRKVNQNGYGDARLQLHKR